MHAIIPIAMMEKKQPGNEIKSYLCPKELIEKRRAVYDEFMTYRRKKEKDLEVLKLQYSELRTGKYISGHLLFQFSAEYLFIC